MVLCILFRFCISAKLQFFNENLVNFEVLVTKTFLALSLALLLRLLICFIHV